MTGVQTCALPILLKHKTLWAEYKKFADEGKLARPPKGYAADTPHIEYIKQKSFIVWTEVSVKGMDAAKLKARIAAGFKLSLPLVLWLREVVKRKNCC